MRDFTRMGQPQAQTAAQSATSFDAGLRAHMIKVYNYMAIALLVTGLVAYFASTSEALMQTIFGTPLAYVIMLAPLAFVLALSFGIQKMNTTTAQIVFWAYSAVMGLSLSTIFLVYTGESIARTFFISAGSFAALSLYGYTTKKDLSGFGSFLIMGLFGIVIASLFNIFFKSEGLSFAISIIGVFVFAGLTAYDTQRIKQTYYEVVGYGEAAGKAAIMGALSLYLDFINLFMTLLHFLGNRR